MKRRNIYNKNRTYTVTVCLVCFISFYFFVFFCFSFSYIILCCTYISQEYSRSQRTYWVLNSFILLLLLGIDCTHVEHRTRFGTFRYDLWWILIWTFAVFQLLYSLFLIIAYEIHLVFWWKRNSFRVYDGLVLMQKLRISTIRRCNTRIIQLLLNYWPCRYFDLHLLFYR